MLTCDWAACDSCLSLWARHRRACSTALALRKGSGGGRGGGVAPLPSRDTSAKLDDEGEGESRADAVGENTKFVGVLEVERGELLEPGDEEKEAGETGGVEGGVDDTDDARW